MGKSKKIAACCIFLGMVSAVLLLRVPQAVSAGSAAAVPGYEVKEDKIEYKDSNGKVRGVVSFQYPQFTGSSPAIAKINRQLRKKSQRYFQSENAENIRQSTKYSMEGGRFYDDTQQYYWTTGCQMAYAKGSIVSFHMTEEWYAGGVHNQYEYGLNYDLSTGKKLTVKDAVGGNAKAKIQKAAKKYCKDDMAAYSIVKNTKKYKFYFEEGKVYICYGSYELGRGTGHHEFAVQGRYQ